MVIALYTFLTDFLRVMEGPRTGEYLFSPGTVENIREYYELILMI